MTVAKSSVLPLSANQRLWLHVCVPLGEAQRRGQHRLLRRAREVDALVAAPEQQAEPLLGSLGLGVSGVDCRT